jgi:hypothetical protein
MLMPLEIVVTSTGPEKHTVIRGFGLNPSSSFNKIVLIHSAAVGADVQLRGSGRFTLSPVFCEEVWMVKALVGNGPTEGFEG